MSETVITPMDNVTGIPLPIYPNPNLPPVVHPPVINSERLGDWHHPFHPRDTLVRGTLGQQALRNCRVQWTEYNEHHDGVGYHHYFDGPILPTKDADIFRTVVFAAAKFLPDRALSFDARRGARVVKLDDAGRHRLLEDGIIKVANRITVRNFMVDYLARNGGLYADQKRAVERFLDTSDQEDKLFLGRALIGMASRAATASIESEYDRARRSHKLPAQQTTKPAAFVSNFVLLSRRDEDTKSIQMFEKSLRLAA